MTFLAAACHINEYRAIFSLTLDLRITQARFDSQSDKQRFCIRSFILASFIMLYIVTFLNYAQIIITRTLLSSHQHKLKEQLKVLRN
jgi:hypothetical protein